MSAFSGLKLVAAKRPQNAAPAVMRRAKLVGHITEQMELARACAAGTTYAPMRVRSVLDKATGLRSSVQHTKRVKQWWFVADTGRVCLQIRYGTRVLELKKNMNSIDVGSTAELLGTLEVVKSAVEAGELDAQIDAASAAVRARFVK
jgi:hypothetical protein